jgi:hypothetical protein
MVNGLGIVSFNILQIIFKLQDILTQEQNIFSGKCILKPFQVIGDIEYISVDGILAFVFLF